MKNFSAEFDISVLSIGQQDWLFERAQNHHFDTVELDRIDDIGATLTVLYDDGLILRFYVEPNGNATLISHNME